MTLRALAAAAMMLAATPPALAQAPAAPAAAPLRVRAAADAAGFSGQLLLASAGHVTLLQGFGPQRFTAATRWRWASVTKQLTATLAMQEVAAGRLALDAPITRYLPGFAGPTGKGISVAMLLGHMSGLPDSNADDGAAFRPGYRGSLDPRTGLCAGPVRDQPGASFHYDNCDYLVAGALLERVTGQGFARLVQQRLARPLGMTSVAVAGPHVGGLEAGGTEAPVNLAAYGSAAGLTGTIADLWRFDQALIDGRLLPAAARATLWDGRPERGYAALGQWVFAAALPGCATPQRIVERRGAIGGVQVRNYILPERNIVVIAMTNRSETDFGELWQGQGLGVALLSAAACGA